MSIKSFTDLNAWKEAHRLVVSIYKLSGNFPQRETFALSDQMRRAAVSITSNIAEGFARNTKKEKIHFYSIALGSLSELESQLLIARDLAYIAAKESFSFINEVAVVRKLLHGLFKTAHSYSIHDSKY